MLIVTILMVLLVLLFMGLSFCVIMMRKNSVTYKNHMIINNAIYKYNIERINNRTFVKDEADQCQMEGYDKTMWRLWDWGYENILPKEIFEKVKPYINKINANR